jgi:hypothetical protein
MSFEIKYNRDGEVIKDKSQELHINQVAEQQAVLDIQPKVMENTLDIQPENLQQILTQQTIQDNPESESEYSGTEIEETPVQQARKTPADSFRELRLKAERAEKAERERDEMMRKLYEYENYNQNSKQKQMRIESPIEEELSVAADDLVEGKHLSKVDKKVRQLEEQLKAYQQQTATATTEARLKAQYADFDKVVSKDNIEMLAYTYPELANALNSTSDLYSKAVSAYMMIKNTGVYKEETFIAEKKRVQENAAKPRLSPAVSSAQQGESPLTKASMFADGLTPQLQEQLRREMNEIRKAN